MNEIAKEAHKSLDLWLSVTPHPPAMADHFHQRLDRYIKQYLEVPEKDQSIAALIFLCLQMEMTLAKHKEQAPFLL